MLNRDLIESPIHHLVSPTPDLVIHEHILIDLVLPREIEMLHEIRNCWTYKRKVIDQLLYDGRRRIARDETISANDCSSFVVAKEKHYPSTIEVHVAALVL